MPFPTQGGTGNTLLMWMLAWQKGLFFPGGQRSLLPRTDARSGALGERSLPVKKTGSVRDYTRGAAGSSSRPYLQKAGAKSRIVRPNFVSIRFVHIMSRVLRSSER